MARRAYQIGEKFNRLTLVAFSATSSSGKKLWLCKCDCGNTRIVPTSNLQNGHTKSCGCLQEETRVQNSTTHGKRRTKEYSIWCGIKKRCYNKNEKIYPRYGGRGIVMCDSWKESFQNFYSDMGECPSGHSIERKNNDGNYEPQNCEWATMKTQARNRTSSAFVYLGGAKVTLAEFCEKLNLHQSSVWNRAKKHNESRQQAANYYVCKHITRTLNIISECQKMLKGRVSLS